ncbi:MAG: hypothetical protein ABJC61_04180 [Acidobacteriota bacterium]
MPGGPDQNALLRHFREAFAADPSRAYPEWYRAQEELRDSGPSEAARALAEDLWSLLDGLSFSSEGEKARFRHNLAVFFGSAGPAADLGRARRLFVEVLDHFSSEDDAGWRARAHHNFATALANLGETPETLEEAVSLFESALAWRTSQREIARGVSLHNLGRALHRWADLEPKRSRELLERSAAAFAEAVEIRGRHGLNEGRALSLFQSGLALEALGRPAAAREALESAAEEFDRLGKAESAAIALARANAHASTSAADPDPDPDTDPDSAKE